MKICFTKTNPSKNKRTKKKRQKVSNGESQTPDLRRGSLMCYLERHNDQYWSLSLN